VRGIESSVRGADIAKDCVSSKLVKIKDENEVINQIFIPHHFSQPYSNSVGLYYLDLQRY